MVDICSVIVFGKYETFVWMPWLRGTLIFAFVVVSLVYYSGLIQKIKDHYFPKKIKEGRKKYFNKNLLNNQYN